MVSNAYFTSNRAPRYA